MKDSVVIPRTKQETIENFIQVVLDHRRHLLRNAGYREVRARLIRPITSSPAPQYGPESLISAEDYQRQAWGETINEMTVVTPTATPARM